MSIYLPCRLLNWLSIIYKWVRAIGGTLRSALVSAGSIAALLLIMLLMLPMVAYAQQQENRFNIYFQVGESDIDTSFMDNGAALDSIRSLAVQAGPQGALSVKGIRYEGYASPEGPAALNRRLSQQRRRALEKCVGRYFPGLDSLVSRSDLIYDPAVAASFANASPDERRDMIGNFGKLRFASVVIISEMQPELSPVPAREHDTVPEIVPAEPVAIVDMTVEPVDSTAALPEVKSCRPLYIGLKTNMLYDALLIPTLGAEIYVGRNVSIAGQWSYAWWSRNVRHRYWRYYGGDAGARWWFGRLADKKPLTGHHIGIYGQIFTYDFENGGSGQMGAKFNYGGGIEYGFALPIGPRLNIDFSIGIGYIAGRYYKYKPIDGHYVWQSTHKRCWFGPTKAEISLVWLVGCGNRNEKGGSR